MTSVVKLEKEEVINGCEAVARAVMLADVDVIATYPIRPYTEVMDIVQKQIADGQMDAELIHAESEHSQFEIAKHASACGARSFAGSSGTGWLYGTEAIVITATDRLPVVAMVGNRSLDDPGAFGVEHNDALIDRDIGWMLVWVDSQQEALDTTLIAYRVAEDPSVMLPCAVATDGAFLTHSTALVRVPDKSLVDKFLPPYNLGNRVLHPDNPVSVAPQVDQDWVMELRKQNDEAMKRSKGVIRKAYAEFYEIFKRGDPQSPFIEEYMTDGADYVLVGMGTLSSPVKVAVRKLREKGEKVGFVRVRWFRPFPAEDLRKSLAKFKAVGVVDRDYSFGSPNYGGILYNEVRSTLYSLPNRPSVICLISGLGGREVSADNAVEMFRAVEQAYKKNNMDVEAKWIGLRE